MPSLEQREPDSSAPPERACLSNDEMLAFALGHLDRNQLEAAQSHVDRCALCQRLLTEAMHALVAESVQEAERAAYNTMFARNILVAERYRITRFIARGGMGEVYEAYDGELRGRVALKTVLSTTCDSSRAVCRLKAEVALARRVSHPNVCRIYDFGTHQLQSTGALVSYLTMEFVDGEPLGQYLRRWGALPLDQAVQLGRQLLLGLGAAHRAGILHRDLKSDNVMIRRQPDGGRSVVILDFGLARCLDPAVPRFTSGGNQGLIGTLSYMAPEQIEGTSLSPAADIYSFGVVWFEMLTGRLPFEADSAPANALERLHKLPVVPSSIRPDIPKALDAVVLRCLGRNPEDRFQTAEQVVQAIDALARSSPVRPQRLRRRIPAVTASLSAALGLALGVWLPTPPAAGPAVTDAAASMQHRRLRARLELSVPGAVQHTAAPSIAAGAVGPSLSPAAPRAAPIRRLQPNTTVGSQRSRIPRAVARVQPEPQSIELPAPVSSLLEEPASERATPQVTSGSNSVSVSVPAPSAKPGRATAHARKPDWENPFETLPAP